MLFVVAVAAVCFVIAVVKKTIAVMEPTFAVTKREPEKNSGLYGNRTPIEITG